jgi:hypothetical protein
MPHRSIQIEEHEEEPKASSASKLTLHSLTDTLPSQLCSQNFIVERNTPPLLSQIPTAILTMALQGHFQKFGKLDNCKVSYSN